MKRLRKGAMVVLFAICLPVLLILVAMAVNVAYMQLIRTELRAATDASARAAGRRLSMDQSDTAARAEAHIAAGRNLVAGDPLGLHEPDIQFGFASQPGFNDRYTFQLGVTPYNSIRITGSRQIGSASGTVSLFMSGVTGKDSFEPQHVAVSTQIERDIVIVMDRSGSMGWDTPTRFEEAKVAVDAFLAALLTTPQTEQVGLVSYATTSSHNEDLTGDYVRIQSAMNSLPITGSTAIGKGLREGIDTLLDHGYDRPFAAKTIVVLTDGIHNTGLRPEPVATEAADRGIQVHAISFSAGADQDAMEQVAQNGGGKHFHAPTGAALVAAFNEIARNNPTLLTE